MKRFLYAVALALGLTSFVCSEPLKTVYNPFTGKLDYITKVDSTTLPSGSTNYIQNQSTLQSGATAYPSNVFVGSLSPSQCVQTDSNNKLISSGSGCGGSGSSSSLAVSESTIQKSSPTAIVDFNAEGFDVALAGGATAQVSLSSSIARVDKIQTFTRSQTYTSSNTHANFGAVNGISVIPNTAIPSSTQTGAIWVDNTLNKDGSGVVVYSSAATQTALNGLIYLQSDTTSYNEPMMFIQSNSTSSLGGNADIRIDANNPDVEMIEEDRVLAGTGNGKWEFGVNADEFYIAPRNAGDTSFQRMISYNRDYGQKFLEMDGNFDYIAWRASETLAGSYRNVLPTVAPETGALMWMNNLDGDGDYNWIHRTYGTFYNDLASGATTFIVNQNDSTGDPAAVRILNDGAGNSLYAENAEDVGTASGVSGSVFINNTFNPGIGLQVYSNNASPNTTNGMAFFRLANTAATGRAVRIDNEGTGNALRVVQNGLTGNSLGSSGAMFLDNTQNTGIGFQLFSSTPATGALMHVFNDTTTLAAPLVVFESSSTNANAPGLRVKSQVPGIELQEIDSTVGTSLSRFKMDVNGDTMRFLSRNGANSGFETFLEMNPVRNGMGLELQTTGYVQFNDNDNTRYVQLKASDTVVNNLVFKLPNADGSAAQVLHTTGNGEWYFDTDDTAAGGGDNLGSHRSTTTLIAQYSIEASSVNFSSNTILAGTTFYRYASPQFDIAPTIVDLTASQFVVTNANKKLVSQSQITDTQIADGAVDGGTGGEIADGSIAAIDLGDGSVNGGSAGVVTDGSITADDLGNDSVGASELTAGAIQPGDIGSDDLPSDGYASTYVNVTGDTMTGGLTVQSSGTFTQGIRVSTAVFTSSMTLSGERVVRNVAPSDGQVLKWVAANTAWEPGTDATGAGAGDNLGDHRSTTTLIARYSIEASSVNFSSNTILAGTTFFAYASPQFDIGPTIADLTASQLVATNADKKLISQSQITDAQIADGAVDGGNLGEIADASITADDLGADSVSASELNATGVEAELEAVLDINELQGVATSGQLPTTVMYTDVNQTITEKKTHTSSLTLKTDALVTGLTTVSSITFSGQITGGSAGRWLNTPEQTQTLTDGANIAWNLNNGGFATVTLAGNRTLDNPTNMKAGASYILIVKQDGTGTRTLAYGTAYLWPGNIDPVLTTAINSVDILTFVSDGTSMYGSHVLDFR